MSHDDTATVDVADLPDPDDPDDAEAWRLAEEFDRRAREPSGDPDPELLAAVADTASGEILMALLSVLGGLCGGGDPPSAEHYAAHLLALGPLLGTDGARRMRAAVDVQTALLHARAGDREGAEQRLERSHADLADLWPGLLGDREWVLACLADADGRVGDAHDHAARARDLFADDERWTDAASAAAAAAATHMTMTPAAMADWRRAVELHTTADEPDAARECVEQACGLLFHTAGDPAADQLVVAGLCATARQLTVAHALPDLAARLGLAEAMYSGDSDAAWDEVVDRHEQSRQELLALDADPAVQRVESARVDASLGRAALAHQRPDDAERLLSGALVALQEAGLHDEAQMCEAMLVALRAALRPDGACALDADRFTDPQLRTGFLLTEALRLVAQGRSAEALARLRETGTAGAAGPHGELVVAAVTAVVGLAGGDRAGATATLARLDDVLAGPDDGLARSVRGALTQVAELLRAQLTGPAVAAPAAPPEPDVLAEVVPLTDTAATVAAPADAWPWHFARCWMRVDLLARRGGTGVDLQAAYDAIEQVPRDAPGLPRLAAALLDAHLRSGLYDENLPRMALVLPVAERDADPPEHWTATAATVRAFLAADAAYQERIDAVTASAEIDECLARVGDTEPYATAVRSARIGMAGVAALEDNDIGAHPDLADDLREIGGRAAPGSPAAATHQVTTHMQAGLTALARGDVDGAVAALDRADALRDTLPPDSRVLAELDRAKAQIAPLRPMLGVAPGSAPTRSSRATVEAELAPLRTAAARPDQSRAERAFNLVTLGGAELSGAERAHDPALLDAAVGHLRDAVAVSPPDGPHHLHYLTSYAGGLLRRYEVWQTNGRGALFRRDLDVAATTLREARTLAGGPAHRSWSLVCQILAEVERHAGQRARSRATALDGLRGHAYAVLLQSRPGAATAAARHAATDAVGLARRALADRAAADTVAALDAGRGLVLRAAVQFGDVADRLARDGAPELAERWRTAAGDGDPDAVPFGLRREVVDRLAAGGAGTDPPDLADIRAALARLGHDVLVYLVPGDADAEGVAVVVPAVDEVSALALPALDPARAPALDGFLDLDTARDTRWAAAAGGSRDMGLADPVVPRWRDALDPVCRWAWSAAVGDLLDQLAEEPAVGATPRIVLVPMGPLARVPWHAAVGPDGTVAVERAVFSYAVSAGQLCDAAAADAVAATTGGLVIGDPDTGVAAQALPAARVEAVAVHRRFHPQARYLGRGPATTGRGGRAEVTAWLADERTEAGVVLHAACHGTMRAATDDDPTSFLHLADRETLSAEDLVRTLSTRRTRPLALAVLAACSSAVPSRGYDEAFSVATAFLTAGTRTVVAALWRIPDADTSVLMYLFHHFRQALPAVHALRAAQLWMLRPDERAEVDLPDEIRAELSRGDPTSPAAWAGFVHMGR